MTRPSCAVRPYRAIVRVCMCGRRGTRGLAVGVAISLSRSRPLARSLPACTPTARPRPPKPLSSPRPRSRAARLAHTRLPPHAAAREHARARTRPSATRAAKARACASVRPPVRPSRLETVDRYNRNARAVPSSFAPRIRSLPHQSLARGNLCVCVPCVRPRMRSLVRGRCPRRLRGETRAHEARALRADARHLLQARAPLGSRLSRERLLAAPAPLSPLLALRLPRVMTLLPIPMASAPSLSRPSR